MEESFGVDLAGDWGEVDDDDFIFAYLHVSVCCGLLGAFGLAEREGRGEGSMRAQSHTHTHKRGEREIFASKISKENFFNDDVL